ncbi:TetR/AcrR family transcriptional regulator, partial [Streptomyces sp. ZEA17I]|uniref:TetR/AcrR family transcriptional regulator n=1 Tax=Streptomyces sp. ZEA17I TaxID=2202516 RepID=UPI00215AE733
MTPAVTDGSADPRTARTRARLRAALLAACEHRPLDRVSVAQVVRGAGVGRATFYLHYDDLNALAVDACADVVTEAVDALHAWEGAGEEELRELSAEFRRFTEMDLRTRKRADAPDVLPLT